MPAKKREQTQLIVICDSRTNARKNWGVKEINRDAINAGIYSDSGPTGVHYVLPRDGRVCNGRPPAVLGSHINGIDSRAVYIMLIGGMNQDETEEKDTFTETQMVALLGVVRLMLIKYPKAAVVPSGLVSVNDAGPAFDVMHWAATHIGTMNSVRYHEYLLAKAAEPGPDLSFLDDILFTEDPNR